MKSFAIFALLAFISVSPNPVHGNDSESSGVVAVQYKAKDVCTGIQLDVDFVLTSTKCVNVTHREVLSVAVGNETRIIDRVSTNFGFALLHVFPSLTFDTQQTLTSLERPEKGEECEVLSFNNEVGFKAYTVRVIDCGGSLARKPVICIRGYFKRDPGVVLKCRNSIAGSYIHSRVFADISPFNDWIDETFRTIVRGDPQEPDALAAEELKVVEAFPDLDAASRMKLVCLLQFSECYKSFSSDSPVPPKCKRGFHPYSCDFLLKTFDLGQELPQGREARSRKLDYRADSLEDGVLKEFWSWIDHHNKQYLGF